MSCNHQCENCQENCDSRVSKEEMLFSQNEKSDIKKIIGVVSGKGGVGKSMVSSLLACALARAHFRVGLLDADITGPSIPHVFGIHDSALSDGTYIYPAVTETLGIEIISSNMLLEKEDDPVLWRGSLISNLVGQFYQEVRWDEKDVLVIDMPPGTGDVALTAFQSIPLDGILVVTTPQELVSVIVRKALKMAELMEIPVLGIVENMSYVLCPHCKEKIEIYENRKENPYASFSLPVLSRLPIDPKLSSLADIGRIEDYETKDFDKIVTMIKELKVKEKKRK